MYDIIPVLVVKFDELVVILRMGISFCDVNVNDFL